MDITLEMLRTPQEDLDAFIEKYSDQDFDQLERYLETISHVLKNPKTSAAQGYLEDIQNMISELRTYRKEREAEKWGEAGSEAQLEIEEAVNDAEWDAHWAIEDAKNQ